jgi:mRNA interferase RelE/StbE
VKKSYRLVWQKRRMYDIRFTPSALRDLKKLKLRIHAEEFGNLMSDIRSLAINPRQHGCIKLKGIIDGYRLRIGDYRVIYQIHDKARIISIGRITRRSESTYNF